MDTTYMRNNSWQRAWDGQARGLLLEFSILNISKQADVQNEKHVQMLGFQYSAIAWYVWKENHLLFLDN